MAFNWFGYSLCISYLEHRANTMLEARVDAEEYDAGQLVEIKIPVTGLPYYSNSAQYERKDGQIEIEGILLNFVKMRIHNDSLEVLCIPNSAATALHSAKDDFFKQANDLQNIQGKSNGNNAAMVKYFPLGHYTAHNVFQLGELFFQKLKPANTNCCTLPFFFLPAIENPPENC